MSKLSSYLWVAIAISTMYGCKTTTTVVSDTTQHNSTEYIYKYVRDSVYVDRWHTQWIKGDTVYRLDSLVYWRDRLLRDTVCRTDTVYKSHIQYKESIKTKPLPWWFYVITLLSCAIIAWQTYKALKSPVGKTWAKIAAFFGDKWR